MDQRRNIRILHLLSQRPDSTGSGIYVQAMLREANARGHINYLLAGIQEDSPPNLECIDEDSCSYVHFSGADISDLIVGMSDVMPYQSRRFCDLADNEMLEYEGCFESKMRNAVEKFKPDIIHSHHLWVLSSLARRTFPKLPIVTTCHGSDLRQFQKCEHLQESILSGCRGLDAVMALSEEQKKEIKRLYKIPLAKIYVVGAGYDRALFSPGQKPDPYPVKIVYAGKLSRSKGVPWLLRALAKIDTLPWQLHLIGDGSGEEKKECLELARNLGERVIIYGSVTQQDLSRIMKQSHIFVLPSFYEGLGLVVLEAIACGCRIIATGLPGIIELLGDIKTDYIKIVALPRLHSVDMPFAEDEKKFEKDLKVALENQIVNAAEQPSIGLSQAEERLALFTWENVFRRVEKVYFKAI